MDIQQRNQSAARRVAGILERRIHTGEYAPNVWLPTEQALADELSVSRPVVRTAISYLAEQGLVLRRPGCRPLVNVAGAEAPSMPRAAPGTLSLRAVAAIMPQNAAYHAGQAIAMGIQKTLRQLEEPYRVVVFDTERRALDTTRELERKALLALEQESYAGAIIWHAGGDTTLPILQRLDGSGFPMVFVDRYPQELTSDFVGTDNRAAAREATAYLLRLDHHRIGHITDSILSTTVVEREEGYGDALLGWGIHPSPELVFRLPATATMETKVAAAVDHFLSLQPPPTAIFAFNDMAAHHFIAQLEERGVHVPDDMSVVGFDDLDRYSPRPGLLTTMHQPFEEIGERAAGLLLNRLSTRPLRQPLRQHILLQAPLVERCTARSPHIREPGGRRAGTIGEVEGKRAIEGESVHWEDARETPSLKGEA